MFTVAGEPPFTARGSTLTFTNELVGEVGEVGEADWVGDCGEVGFPPHAAAKTAIIQRQRPLRTAEF